MTDVATPSTDVEVIDETRAAPTDVEALIASMSNPSAVVYSSFAAESFEDRLKTLAALTDTEPLNEHLGELIQLRNFIAQPVSIADPVTGVVSDTARVIIVDEDGSAYHCTSLGVANALRNISAIMRGEPSTWESAVPVVAAEERTRRGFRVLTLKVDFASFVPKGK